ncbi:MAG: CGGC domain-containing protein [Sphingobacteriia bacterium]|jgi:predicted metal-binding protein|nr:CGGC domain-containing protein [Sphingobacteriia bacterium]
MKKIMIFICGEISKKCSANGCFRTFNDRVDAFGEYAEDEDLQLVAFNTCPGCNEGPVENLKSKIEKIRKSGADTVHISTCIRGRCDNYEEFAKILGDAGFNVIGYTHGSLGGKRENTIWIEDGEIRKFKKD